MHNLLNHIIKNKYEIDKINTPYFDKYKNFFIFYIIIIKNVSKNIIEFNINLSED